MEIVTKERSQLTKREELTGEERLPINGYEYITPSQIAKLSGSGESEEEIANLQNQITNNKKAIDKLNGDESTTDSISQKITKAIEKLDVIENSSEEVNGVSVTINETDGKIRKPVVNIKPGTITANNTNLVTGGAVYTAINNALGSVYKVKGSYSTLDALEDGVAEANRKEGDVYNIEQEFTLTNKKYPAGTNVVWVAEQTIGQLVTAAHWDALGGTIDLSNFATAAQGKLADTAMQGASGDSYISAVAGGTAGKTVTVTANVTKMADVKTGTVALADAADVKSYVDTKASAAASAGVTSLGGKTGAISVDSGKTTLGDVNFTISDDKKLTGSVAGIKSAAGKEASEFATAAQGAKADRAVQSVTGSGCVKVVKDDAFTNGAIVSVTTKDIKTATERDDGLATASDVQSYVSTSIKDAMVWAEFA